MPLFRSRSPVPEDAPPVEEPRQHSLFSRNRESTTNVTPPAEEPRHHGLFSRNRNSTSSEPSIASNHSSRTNTTTATAATASSGRRSHNFLRRDREDSSITAAREQVRSAEVAEADADRALMNARQAVKEAREHVRRLEMEAAEEARLAKIKQDQAAAIGKRGMALGRHDIRA